MVAVVLLARAINEAEPPATAVEYARLYWSDHGQEGRYEQRGLRFARGAIGLSWAAGSPSAGSRGEEALILWFRGSGGDNGQHALILRFNL